jgi:hypothetical protein
LGEKIEKLLKVNVFAEVLGTSLVITGTVKPVLNGISRIQYIFPLKPGFHLIKVYYDSHGT